MYRMMFVLLPVVLTLGCAASKTILEDTRIDGLKVYRFSRVDSMQEFTDGEREVIFNYHLNESLEGIGNSLTYDDLDFSSLKMREKLRAIERARPERKMVNTAITNFTWVDLICHIYPVGSSKEFASVRVPAGATTTAKLRENERYRTVWTFPDGQPTGWEREYNKPAFEGIEEQVWSKS